METAKPRNLVLPLTVAVILLMLAVASSVVFLGDHWTRKELRGISEKMVTYLMAHDGRWPQPAGSPGPATPADWWTTSPAQLRSGAFQIARFDKTPNIAFYDSHKPWLIYTSWNGHRYELLPNGSVSVSKPR